MYRALPRFTSAEFADLLSHGQTTAVGNADCFVLVRTVLDEAEILTVATRPAKRRQGLARKRLDDAEALAKSQGAEAVFLEVAEDNMAAIRLQHIRIWPNRQAAGLLSAQRWGAYRRIGPAQATDHNLTRRSPVYNTAFCPLRRQLQPKSS